MDEARRREIIEEERAKVDAAFAPWRERTERLTAERDAALQAEVEFKKMMANALHKIVALEAEVASLRAAAPWDLIERTANEARNWDAALTDDQATVVEAFALHLLATRETQCPRCGSTDPAERRMYCLVTSRPDPWHTAP